MSDAKMGDGIKLFLLDDEEDVCLFSREFLVKRGFQVKTAYTGPEALGIIKDFKPDIALLDVNLSEGNMNGIEVLRVIRKEQPNCRCVMLTVVDKDTEQFNEIKNLGVEEYLVKPLLLENVEATLGRIAGMIKKGGK